MLLIRGDRRVADIYFTEFNRLWGHYYYRSSSRPPRSVYRCPALPPAHDYQDLYENTDWLKDYEPGDLRTKRVNQYVQMAI